MKSVNFQSCLQRHWSFKLFKSFQKVHYVLISTIFSLAIYILGLLIFALVGNIRDYVTSLLPYMFLVGFILIISSYGWWMNSIVRMLNIVFPAFDISVARFKNLIIIWDKTWLNSIGAIIILATPFALSNARDVINLWNYGIPIEMQNDFARWAWGVWLSSPAAPFFGVWYGFLHIILTSLALGSGVAGVLSTINLIQMIGKQKLKLAYYRKLDAPVALSSNLAFWVFIALIAVSLFSRPTIISIASSFQLALAGSLSKESLTLIISTVIQTLLAFLTLIGIFGRPLYICHLAIQDAKIAYSANLIQRAEELYLKIKDLSEAPTANKDKKNFDAEELSQLQKQLSVTNSLIKEIDEIPTWPISVSSKIQMISGFGLSIILPVATNWFTSILTT